MTLEEAAQKAINGETIRFFDAAPGGKKHEFHIKPVAVSRTDNSVFATGWISHHLKWRPDDQINYEIRKDGGQISDINTNIERGGLGRLVNNLGDLIPLPVADAVGKLIDGKWEGECAQIIFMIAKKL